MQPTLNEIAQLLGQDSRPSPFDGASNVERIAYITTVFGVDVIDLNEKFPYNALCSTQSEEHIVAGIHLAKLQMCYVSAVSYAGHLDEEETEVQTCYLSLMIMKMQWHLDHFKAGRPTPPFTFIN